MGGRPQAVSQKISLHLRLKIDFCLKLLRNEKVEFNRFQSIKRSFFE